MGDKVLKYFKGDELAASVWKNKYQLQGEETPDDMHKRLAKSFADKEMERIKNEDKYSTDMLSEYGQNRRPLTFDRIYNYFKNFKYIIPQGSIMSGLGTDLPVSLSNCWVVNSPYDSYAGILRTDSEFAFYFKRRGGVGTDLSTLRPNGTPTKNSAKTTTGAVSFMHRYSNTTRETAMNGRRGASMLTMDIAHPDSLEFIKVKRDKTSVTGANISIRLRSDFMDAVKNGGDYYLRFPVEFDINKIDKNTLENLPYNELKEVEKNIYVKRIKAKEYWDEIIYSARNFAEPGLLYWDNILNYDPTSVYEGHKPISTNPCVSGDTKILTNKGYYNIENLINQEVKVWNGKEFSTVTPKITGFNQDMLNIKLSDGREVNCTLYHNWYIWEGYSRDGKLVEKEAKELKVGDKIIKYDFPVVNYGKEVPSDIAYSQGFYSGDGTKNSNDIWLYGDKIKLSNVLNGKFIGNEYTISTGVKKRNFKLGFKNKPKNYVPVNDYSVKSRLDWLAGLIDSDGTITKDKGIQISSNDYDFLLNVQYLISTLGCNTKIVKGNNGGLQNMPDGKGGSKQYNVKEVNRILIGAMQVKSLIDLGLVTYRVSLNNVTPNRDASRFTTIIGIKKQPKPENKVYCFNEPLRHSGIFNGVLSGNCSEQAMNANESCRLMAMNLFSFVQNPFTYKAGIDYEKLYEVSYEMTRLGDTLVDLELDYIQRIIDKIKSDPEPDYIKKPELELWEKSYENAKSVRRMGIGITALGDMLAALGIKYDDNTAFDVIEQVMKTKMQAELDATIDMAILFEPFEGYDFNKEYEVENDVDDDRKFYYGKNKFYQFLYDTFRGSVYIMEKYGRRNINWSTIAPTGSVSILTQTTSGLEPLFSPYYMRRKKINENDVDNTNVRVDFIDDNGDKWQEYPVFHPKFKDWVYANYKGINENNISNLTKEDVDDLFEHSPWYKSTANDINWKKRIEMQALLQKYTTNAISSTINLPSTVTLEEVSEIYKYGYRAGLKGQTVYVDGSRDGVLVNVDNKTPDNTDFKYTESVKRPQVIDGEAHTIQIAGKKYAVFVGFINDLPYEVFVYEGTTKQGKGKIEKKESGNYVFIGNDENSRERILTDKMDTTQRISTRLVSGNLRHGRHFKFIIEDIEKEGAGIFDWFTAIKKTLAKYLKNGDLKDRGNTCPSCGEQSLVYEEGCKVCKSCGWSACG